MNAIIYLLQVSACLALFYGFYYVMLNRLTFFTINRYYLLVTLVLSFVIPLLTITVHQQYEAIPVVQQVENIRSFKNITYYAPAVANAPIKIENPLTWMQLLKYAYLLAVAGLFTHLLVTLITFFVKLRRRKLSSVGNVHILRGDKNLPNGSFLNYIFLNDDELSADEMQQIIAHEMLHVKFYHSADRLLMKVVQIILWFNPFVYLYARSMEENHEFEVDREIARSTNKTQYADLLVHLSVANQGMLYHSFSKVPLKKRIVMLFNRPSAKVKTIAYVLLLPVIAVSCLAFANIKKDDIKNFNLVKSTKKIISDIKDGQDNMVEQLNKPVQLPVALADARSVKIINLNTAIQPLAIPATIADTNTTRYSEFGDIAKNANIFIDGKQYPHDLIYEISNSNLSAISINKNGNGQTTVDVKTKNGEIIYMTPHEKDNLRRERSTPISQFYTRLQLTEDDGERYDYIVIRIYNAVSRDAEGELSRVPGNYHTRQRIAPDDKVGFIINGQLYSEDELKTIPPAIIASLNNYGSATYRPDMLYQNKYKYLFTLNSPTYQQTRNNTLRYGGGGVSYYPQLGWFSPNDTAKKIKYYRNLGFIGVPVDSITYNVAAYKTSPTALLIELISKLPNFKINDNGIFINGKAINDLSFNYIYYEGSVMQGVKSLLVNNITEIKIYNPDPKSPNPAMMNIITNK